MRFRCMSDGRNRIMFELKSCGLEAEVGTAVSTVRAAVSQVKCRGRLHRVKVDVQDEECVSCKDQKYCSRVRRPPDKT